ncbi:beta-galactosidase small subunit-related protein [Streptomyces sp. NPDC001177]
MSRDPLIALRPREAPEVTSWGRLPMNAVRRPGAVSLDGDWRSRLPPAREGALQVDCRVRDADGALPARWYVTGEPEGHLLARDAESDRVNAEEERERPEPYGLTVRLHRADGTVADTSHHRVGFRDVEIAGRDLLNGSDHGAHHDGERTRPLIQCEYSHAMGNSNGTPADHWAAIEATPGLQGGFIREFWDHGILQRVSNGRPAGRADAGLYDNAVAAPGHRWAYGGDFGETIQDGAFIADGVAFPDRTPQPVLYEHRELTAPVRIECFRHEGIVLSNHQRFRGLDWLSGEWELSLADGRTLSAPAELPDLRPGETAAVPLPFAVPRDGGEAWLTLRVSTAEDVPWAPRGTEVCVPRIRLLGPAVLEDVPADRSVEVDGEGLLIHPLLTAAPALSLWRAPTDDELGGMAQRRRAGGLDSLVRKVVSVRRDGGRVTVHAEYAWTVGVVRHRQVFTPVAGGVRVDEEAELSWGSPLVERSRELGGEFEDVARVGTVFGTAPGLELLEWFGQGPWASYPDRSAGAPGHHSVLVDELFTSCLRPQASGGRHGVRRFTLSAPDATGLAVVLDEPRQVSVTRHRAQDPAAASHHGELVPLPGCVVHIDAEHRGLGTASRGPDTSPRYRIPTGVHRWSRTLRVL